MQNATPKNLTDLVRILITVGPLSEFDVRATDAIKDYIRQKFSIAILENPDQELMLRSLLKKLEAEDEVPEL